MDMDKKMYLIEIMSAVTAAITKDPALSRPTLTYWTVPLNITRPETRAHTGPYPCFSRSSPYPVPSTMNVTMIGIEVLKASNTSFPVMQNPLF